MAEIQHYPFEPPKPPVWPELRHLMYTMSMLLLIICKKSWIATIFNHVTFGTLMKLASQRFKNQIV
ncbi:hypothetical protein NQ314_008055 [Rhamnusium bicolor]|uniref:Uncharacterized protein n=1 Tax=Rhamnusium bicolor TaxID=1586634 RepID=A0AAV8YGN6_9CUCU|nr:hypothetical protein NQ314_008055 [Rhamnusium bicolor]